MDHDLKPNLTWRALRWALSATLTLGVIAGSGAAIFLGSGLLADRAAAVEPPEAAPRMTVDVVPLRLEQGFVRERRFVGQVEAASRVALSFELSGRLTGLSFDEGDTVAEGAVIARLDTSLLEAEQDRLTASRAATLAQLDFAQTRLDRAQVLNTRGHATQETLDGVIATRDELTNRIAEIDAGLASVTINLDKSVLRAPFAGRIGARAVDGGETLSPGQPVMTLIETAAPQMRVGLPLGITPEAVAGARIEIDGTRFDATLAQLRPDIDPVTRTRTALFDLGGGDALFGQTAVLILETPVVETGAWVPLDALQEGAGGVWTVLVVADDVVRIAAVEVLHAEAGRVFVRGTFEDNAALIATGAHRVVPGQAVAPQRVGG